MKFSTRSEYGRGRADAADAVTTYPSEAEPITWPLNNYQRGWNDQLEIMAKSPFASAADMERIYDRERQAEGEEDQQPRKPGPTMAADLRHGDKITRAGYVVGMRRSPWNVRLHLGDRPDSPAGSLRVLDLSPGAVVDVDKAAEDLDPAATSETANRLAGINPADFRAAAVDVGPELPDDSAAGHHADLDPGEIGMMSDAEYYDRLSGRGKA